ncbi:hypothetical protein [Vibrio tapetis]|uniref:Uncharacterized protein n=1 Tax=Vibrio tapetis subsp. tapetis TaxID=1671868 RepID=A0A2N8ZDF0_9VIBR|nr:hypothetical protein [Vibrio tapetis]SON49941.1 exported protein of unknown function [Vibrio tapetis subsp. tapetis]
MYKQTFLRISSPILLAATLAGCGGGDGGSSASTPSVITPSVKLIQRANISVKDAEIEFTGYGQRFFPDVKGRIGSLTLSVDASHIASDHYDNGLLITQAGVVTVTVEDIKSGYETAKDAFTLTIKKGDNKALTISPLHLTTLGTNAEKRLDIQGAKGNRKVVVAKGYENLISVDGFGSIKSKGQPGEAKVLVTDEGNALYAAKTVEVPVTITAVNPNELSYAALKETYRQQLTLQAYKLSGSNTQSVAFSLNADSAKDVIEVNQKTGFITVLKAGSAKVDVSVTYPSGFSKPTETVSFDVTIAKGTNPANLLTGQIYKDYAPESVFHPQLSGIGLSGLQYSVPEGQNVLVIDQATQLPKIINAGAVELTSTIPEGDKYLAWSRSIDVTVSPSAHPGLTLPKAYLTYSPTLVLKVDPADRKGTLSAYSQDNAVWNSDLKQFRITKAGDYELTVIDDGGPNYRSLRKTFKVQVNKAKPAPLRELSSVNVVYAKNLFIELTEKLPKFERPIELASIQETSVASAYSGTKLAVAKAGETRISVRTKSDSNYLASEPASFKLYVAAGSSRLTLKGEATSAQSTWKAGGHSIAPLPIDGVTGKLSYAFAAGHEADGVVSIDKTTGNMTMLKAGKTRITATDSGTTGFKSSTISYDVIVHKATLKMSVSYQAITYKKNAKLMPVEERDITVLSPEPVTLSYQLPEQYRHVVTLVNPATGEVAVQKAGDFMLNVTAKSDNFAPLQFSARGTINKAAHPEIKIGRNSVNFNPRKLFKFNIESPAIGERRFVSDPYNKLTHVTNKLTGEFMVGNLPLSGENDRDTFTVYEAESDNYLAASQGFKVYIHPPLASEADWHREAAFTASNRKVTVASLLGSTASNLQESRLWFKGAKVVQPTEDDIKRYGPGVRLQVRLSLEGSERTQAAPAFFYVTRNDGCLDAPAPIKFDSDGLCSNGPTTRTMTIHSLPENDIIPKGGVWKTTKPISVMRYGARKFIQTPDGGLYRETSPKASRIYEWSLLNFTIRH